MPTPWVYQVNCDQESFPVEVDSGDDHLAWPWSALPTDHRFVTEAYNLVDEGEEDERGEYPFWQR